MHQDTESAQPAIVRQLVDWGAAIRASIIAGTLFLLACLFLTQIFLPGFSSTMMVRYFASILMGNEILAAEASNPLTWRAFLSMGLFHYAMAFAFAVLVAFIVHRWGIVLSAIVGALLGLCHYAVNIYGLTLLVPQFFVMESLYFLVLHILFGAITGTLYEALEFEVFVDADGNVINLEEAKS